MIVGLSKYNAPLNFHHDMQWQQRHTHAYLPQRYAPPPGLDYVLLPVFISQFSWNYVQSSWNLAATATAPKCYNNAVKWYKCGKSRCDNRSHHHLYIETHRCNQNRIFQMKLPSQRIPQRILRRPTTEAGRQLDKQELTECQRQSSIRL